MTIVVGIVGISPSSCIVFVEDVVGIRLRVGNPCVEKGVLCRQCLGALVSRSRAEVEGEVCRDSIQGKGLSFGVVYERA